MHIDRKTHVRRPRKWSIVLMMVLTLMMSLPGPVLAADIIIDDFTAGENNLQLNQPGETWELLPAQGSALGNQRMMILGVTQAAGQQNSQWGVSTSGRFASLAIPTGGQGKATIQWDGADTNKALNCNSGLGGVDLLSSDPPNTGMIVRIIGSDSVAKDLKISVYTNCGNWRTLTRPVPFVDDEQVVDMHLRFSDFDSGPGTLNWASINAVELEIDGTKKSGADAAIAFIKTTSTLYEYGDLPLAGTPGLPAGQTGFSPEILAARHLPKNMRLGQSVDAENLYQDSALATEDDGSDFDDEDGVVRLDAANWSSDNGGELEISHTGCSSAAPCYISAWIDWNRDGDFGDSGERILNNWSRTNDGTSNRSITIPAGTSFTDVRYYARFRICGAANVCNSPMATDVEDGEIEDYTWDWAPTAVSLASFSALPEGEGIRVAWETAAELDNLGFNLYRGESPAGPWVKLNAELIGAQNPGAVFGASYEWLDAEVTPGVTVYYRLEDVDVSGVSTFHGPVSATASGVTAVSVAAFGAHGAAPTMLLLTLSTVGALAAARKRRRAG